MKMSLSFISFTLIMTGCASFSGVENAKNIAKLKYGQSQSQVLNILGTPDSVLHPTTTQDQWIYEFKKQDKLGQNMFVEFNDGILVKTGKLSGRDIAAANETRTPGVCTKRVNPEVQQESLCLK
jgi:outer membrane protein assembly factor BamE (lipoprotein component of BamABCDE complex)